MSKEQADDYLGATIKAIRKSRGLTQTQLAGLLKITPRYLKCIENSGRKPSYDLLTRIIRELGIQADTIFNPENRHLLANIYLVQRGKPG